MASVEFTVPASREDAFNVPSWASIPSDQERFYLEVVQDGQVVDLISLSTQAAWVVGRPEKGHIKLLHESISRQHAALVHHSDGRWFVIDLKSATGTFVSKKAVQPYIPAEVLVNATVKFGKSHKDYTLRRGSAPFDLLGDETERQAKKKRADDEDREIISAKRSKPNDTVTQVTASHILVKHRDSRNPSSWREASITRSKQQAVDILSGYIAQIQQGAQTFEQIAKQFSDCSSAKRGGDLGPFRRGEMQAEFENVAYVCESSGLSHHSPNVSVGKEVMLIHMLLACSFGLRVGETSGIVSTASGVHIIKRTA